MHAEGIRFTYENILDKRVYFHSVYDYKECVHLVIFLHIVVPNHDTGANGTIVSEPYTI